MPIRQHASLVPAYPLRVLGWILLDIDESTEESTAEGCSVGVLAVHGIGNQKQGSTLRGLVDSLFSHLQEQIPPIYVGPDLLAVPCDASGVIVSVPPVGEIGAQTWLIDEAYWAESFDPPDRRDFTRWFVADGPWFVFFFIARLWRRFGAEGWEPLFGLVAAALAALAVFLAWGDSTWGFVLLLAALVAASVRARLIMPFLRLSAGGAVVAVTVLLLYPLAAVLTVAMLAVGVVGLLPIPGAAKVRGFEIALAGTVGDVYALVGTPFRERRMRDAIKCAIEKMCGRLDDDVPIVLICHSQGAALTYRLLRQEWPTALDGRRVTFLTYGSALVPIHVLERLRNSAAGRRRLIAAVGLVSLLGLAALLMTAVTIGQPAWLSWVFFLVVGVGLAAATVAGIRDSYCLEPDSGESGWTLSEVVHGHGHVEEAEEFLGKNRKGLFYGGVFWRLLRLSGCRETPFLAGLDAHPAGLRWVDLWGTWDPVPNGPLLLSMPTAVPPGDPLADLTLIPAWQEWGVVVAEPYQSANAHQPWLDHVNYRTNREEVLARFAVEITAVSLAEPELFAADLTKLEHWSPEDIPAGVPDPPDYALVNGTARFWRRNRRLRGRIVLALNFLALFAGVVSAIMRRERLPELGDRVLELSPAPVRAVISTPTGLVPEEIRRALAGGVTDTGSFPGFLVVVGAIAFLLGLQWGVAAIIQQRADARYRECGVPSSSSSPLLVGLILAIFTVVPTAVVLGWVEEAPVIPATVVSVRIDGLPAHGEITFHPIGKPADRALTVAVRPEGSRVRIPAGSVVVSDVPGGKDCQPLHEGEQLVIACSPVSPTVDR